jgi:hypothetical protein
MDARKLHRVNDDDEGRPRSLLLRPCVAQRRSAVLPVENSIAGQATNAGGRTFMQQSLGALLILSAAALASTVMAQDEGPPVSVDKAAYHVPVFRNDTIAVLRVNIPGHRSAGYHIHSQDQISVLVEEADQSAQCSAKRRRRRAATSAATSLSRPIRKRR